MPVWSLPPIYHCRIGRFLLCTCFYFTKADFYIPGVTVQVVTLTAGLQDLPLSLLLQNNIQNLFTKSFRAAFPSFLI
jgi:hypothetical protein